MGGTMSADSLVAKFPSYDKPAGCFADEYPRHRVRITQSFYLGKFEVTIGQFRRFSSETGYRTEAEADGQGGWGYNPETGKCEGRRPIYNWQTPGYPQTDNYPVVDVSFHDALAFCQWLSKKEGRTYRLPTEAEWEYANRANTAKLYAGGDDPAMLASYARVVNLERHAKFEHVQDIEFQKGDPSAFPLPVGSLLPNGFGLYDVHGNVWEWVADWYAEDYYAKSPVDDPKGPHQGEVRVRRGGGWNSFPLWARSSFRNWITPGSRYVNLGFRVAMSR